MNTMFNYLFKVGYLVAIYSLLAIPTSAQDNWTWLNPKPMGYSIYGSTVIPSTSTIIAVGTKGVITRSVDQGTSWELIRLDSTQILRSVHFPSSSVGYACGDGSVVLKTTNAGTSWTAVSPPATPGNFVQLQFISENTGFLLDKVNHILHKTTNGGTSWETYLDESSYGTFNSFQMIDGDDGWIGTSEGTVIRITGGIFSYQRAMWGLPVELIRFFDINNGVAIRNGQVKYTTNGGVAWDTVIGSIDFSPYHVNYSTSNNITVVGSGEGIAISTNGGQTWSSPVTDALQVLYAVTFTNSTHGLINGDSGAQYRTTDGGASWTKTSSIASEVQLNTVAFTGELTGFAAGGSGRLLRTTDGGTTWTVQTIVTNESIFKLFFVNSSIGFATAQTKMMKTINGGASWTQTTPGYVFQDIHFKDANNGIGCGTSTNKLAKTTNGGTSWTTITMPDTARALYALAVLPDAQTVICVGATGKIFRSINYGTNWSIIASGTYEQLNSVDFHDQQLGWACGNNGTILHSTDGGLTWAAQTSGTTSHLQSIKFYDGSAGIAVGHNGVMLKTNNGGATWTQYQTVSPYNLNEVVILSSSEAIVVGSGGTIIKGQNLPLPVELVGFTATHKNGTVTLNWETKTEIDNYGFEIERKSSTTGWQKIGFVEGHFTTNSPKYYNYTDRPNGTGKIQYRLKQIDNDGSFEYSPVVEVDLSGMLPKEIEIKNFPNPFNPETNINITLPETADATVDVYNSTGEKVVTLFAGKLNSGETRAFKFDGATLPSGMYIINVTAGKHRKSHKVMLMK